MWLVVLRVGEVSLVGGGVEWLVVLRVGEVCLVFVVVLCDGVLWLVCVAV